jgi:hypothetical protein
MISNITNIVVVIALQYISNRFVLRQNISLGPYAFFQVTNPRNVSFCNVAQPASRATVASVVYPTWQDITQAVGFFTISVCLARTISTVLVPR